MYSAVVRSDQAINSAKMTEKTHFRHKDAKHYFR